MYLFERFQSLTTYNPTICNILIIIFIFVFLQNEAPYQLTSHLNLFSMKLFLSYGHDDFEELAQRLKNDLATEGFEIWMDKDQIKGTADWEIAIENGIVSSDWLVLLMTEHSVRRPDGVCLDEVSYARFIGKQIAPVMIQDVQPPLCIARIQWIDMKNFIKPGTTYFDEKSYQTKKSELIAILQGIKALSIEGEQHSLRTRLNPLDNDVISSSFKKDFFGRERLADYFDAWCGSENKLMWLAGNAGVGKTAFVSYLTSTREAISAVHFCRYNDNERANPKRAIMSIAYYLATQINEYRNQVLLLQDLPLLTEKSTSRLFDYLIVEPLSRIGIHHKTTVIVIDALDEASVDGKNELADVIVNQFRNTPQWIKLLVTSRNDPLLQKKFGGIKPVSFADKNVNDNESDIKGYLAKQLTGLLPTGKKGERILSVLTHKSDGLFLYAKNIADSIKEKKLDINHVDSFPEGLTGIYLEYFDRIFDRTDDVSYKTDIRPIFEILCSTYMPVSSDVLIRILDLDEYDLDDALDVICEMFPMKENIIEPIHKSIVDWLIDPKRSGKYRVSKKKGHERIADYNLSLLENRKWNHYTLQYLCRHLIALERKEETVNILSNLEFQEARINAVGLDSAIREYLFEIKKLSCLSVDSAYRVMRSETFVNLFTKHRKFFYNSGLYFDLKECNFDKIASDTIWNQNITSSIGVAYYYYITESFHTAINKIIALLSNAIIPSINVAELYNLLGLCYRKEVDFVSSKECFEKAYHNDGISDYERANSLKNLGKLAYHGLNWEEAEKYNEQARLFLTKELNTASDDDSKVSLSLYLAEYHRLTAECLIWNFQLDAANRELSAAETIYSTIPSRDRYYIRFLYTSAFRNILRGDFQRVQEDCELLLSQATSTYDKSQIHFYIAISSYKLHDEVALKEHLVNAYKCANLIGAWLEQEEILALSSFSGIHWDGLSHYDGFSSNKSLQKWIGHVIHFFDKTLK